MPRTIEVSDGFYRWLQSLAVPLEDTTAEVCDRIMSQITGDGDSQQAAAARPVVATITPVSPAASGRRKINERVLRTLGVSHFEVAGHVPDWEGKKAHPRAYLDAMFDNRLADFKYYERHKPYGDAASRVILVIGAKDSNSGVHFFSGETMTMADFISAFLVGRL